MVIKLLNSLAEASIPVGKVGLGKGGGLPRAPPWGVG